MQGIYIYISIILNILVARLKTKKESEINFNILTHIQLAFKIYSM